MSTATLDEITIDIQSLYDRMLAAHESACWVSVEADRTGATATRGGIWELDYYLRSLRHHLEFIGESLDTEVRVSRRDFERYAVPIWSDVRQLMKKI